MGEECGISGGMVSGDLAGASQCALWIGVAGDIGRDGDKVEADYGGAGSVVGDNLGGSAE